MSDFSAIVPDELLSLVFDHLILDETLLNAMPVCKRWRAVALEHPKYWQHLTLYNLRGDKVRRLFLLRLERSRDRPIHVKIDGEKDPSDVIHDVLISIAAKSAQLASLRLFLPARTFASKPHPFTSPAPLLEVFLLNYYMSRVDAYEMTRDGIDSGLKKDWFANSAPMLHELHLANVNIGGIKPKWAAQVTHLTWECNAYGMSARMQGIFQTFPNVSHFVFGGEVWLDVGSETSKDELRQLWSQLRTFDLSGIHSDVVYRWDFNELALEGVEVIHLPTSVTDSCLQWLKSIFSQNHVRLSITSPPDFEENEICLAFEISSTRPPATTTRRELREQTWANFEWIAEQTSVMARVVSLHINLEFWFQLLQLENFAAPMLKDLTMVLWNGNAVSTESRSSLVVDFPRLSSVRLIVKAEPDSSGLCPETLDPASIVHFIQKVVLPGYDTSLMDLCLKDVWVHGPPAPLLDEFKSVQFNPGYASQRWHTDELAEPTNLK